LLLVVVIFCRQKYNTSSRVQKLLKRISMEIFRKVLRNYVHFLVRYFASAVCACVWNYFHTDAHTLHCHYTLVRLTQKVKMKREQKCMHWK